MASPIDRNTRRTLAIVAWPLLLAGSVTARSADSIAFETYKPGPAFSSQQDGLDEAASMVIRSQAEWRAVWDKIEPRMSRSSEQVGPHALPTIDFDRHMLILVTLGTRSSGGFTVEIKSLTELATHIEVATVETRPGPSCMVTMSLAHPIALVLVRSIDKPVRFAASVRQRPC